MSSDEPNKADEGQSRLTVGLGWRVCSWLGKHGWFTYNGLRGMQPSWYPQGQMVYQDGFKSEPMAIGIAWSYARMFNGEVVPPN